MNALQRKKTNRRRKPKPGEPTFLERLAMRGVNIDEDANPKKKKKEGIDMEDVMDERPTYRMISEVERDPNTKSNEELLKIIDEALASMKTPTSDYRSFYQNATNFDPVSKVVDILLDNKTSIGRSLDELERIQVKLNDAMGEVSSNRYQEFNDIIYSFEPVDKQMKGIRQFIDELSQSSETIRKELEGSQGDMQPLQNDEFISAYFNDVCLGLQTFEKIERHFESIDFLKDKRNYLAAIEELCILEHEVK